jgi:GTP 3',8-cyclase
MEHPSATSPLTDRFGRLHHYLRIAVTDRCNLRCTYCMPAEGLAWQPAAQLLDFDEITRFAAICVRGGVTKIRLTGGEPLLRPQLTSLVARLRRLSGLERLAVTTNGTRLASLAPELRLAGCDAVNISLDTLREDRFRDITRRNDHAAVLAGVDAALEAGFDSVKINMVVMRGVNDDEVEDFVSLTKERPLHVRFIEYMPFDANGWDAARLVPTAELRARLAGVFPLVETEARRGDVAREYVLPGHRGTIGFISSMTEHFCDGCSRLRLTADGALKVCLFSQGEVDVRALLRGGAGDELVEEEIRMALSGKWRAHPGASQLARQHNRAMIRIGG